MLTASHDSQTSAALVAVRAFIAYKRKQYGIPGDMPPLKNMPAPRLHRLFPPYRDGNEEAVILICHQIIGERLQALLEVVNRCRYPVRAVCLCSGRQSSTQATERVQYVHGRKSSMMAIIYDLLANRNVHNHLHPLFAKEYLRSLIFVCDPDFLTGPETNRLKKNSIHILHASETETSAAQLERQLN